MDVVPLYSIELLQLKSEILWEPPRVDSVDDVGLTLRLSLGDPAHSLAVGVPGSSARLEEDQDFILAWETGMGQEC